MVDRAEVMGLTWATLREQAKELVGPGSVRCQSEAGSDPGSPKVEPGFLLVEQFGISGSPCGPS